MLLNVTPLSERKHNAFILAADAAFFKAFCQNRKSVDTGFIECKESEWILECQSHVVMRERAPLETNPHYRQLVPYVVLRITRENEKPLYFHYQRMKGVGEQRLAGNYSIGIGGHIEAEDFTFYSDFPEPRLKNVLALGATIHDAMHREVLEEFGIFANMTGKPDYPAEHIYYGESYGLILDDSNEVGRVHAGLVYVVDVDDRCLNIQAAEEELQACGFDTAENLIAKGNMEGWTVLLLEHFAKQTG